MAHPARTLPRRTILLTRHCCPDCGGHRVETLDWVAVNGDEFVGGDLGEDYWCPDCETHPSHTEERDVTFELCDTCYVWEWGTAVPLPGLRTDFGGAVHCCEKCAIYRSDEAAAFALCNAIRRRGSDSRVSFVVSGLSA